VNSFMDFFAADPQLAYLIFMGSIALLYAEITHPGLIVPGVLGGVGLILSLVLFHRLDVMWGGLALMILGIGFMIAEIFVTSFGLLGIGGVISFVIGSIFLFENFTLPWALIGGVTLVFASIVLGLGYLAMQTLQRRREDNDYDLKTKPARIVSLENSGKAGKLEVLGEFWNFTSEHPLLREDPVEILERDGLTLKVRKKDRVWNS